MASMKRRLRQAREQLDLPTFSAMQDRLLHDRELLPRLLGYLTVQVSEMFRDPSYFRALREKVTPHLRTYPSLKVWVAGCATGEELYSLVILFREEGLHDPTLFYATDINHEALRRQPFAALGRLPTELGSPLSRSVGLRLAVCVVYNLALFAPAAARSGEPRRSNLVSEPVQRLEKCGSASAVSRGTALAFAASNRSSSSVHSPSFGRGRKRCRP
jgi:hypothetical protein